MNARPGSSSSHDRTTEPCIHSSEIAPEVELVVARVHDLEAFGVGLHQAVFDAVVDHLHVVAGARAADVEVAALGASDMKIGSSGVTASASPPTIRQ